MKKVLITSVLGIMVSFLFIGQSSEAKISGIKMKSIPHTKTVLTTDDEEKIRFSGICDPEDSPKLMDDYESYDVYYEEKNILTVKMVENGTKAENGYYQVDFEIPGTGKKAFITGLTAENVKHTQDSLIENYTGKEDFFIYDMDYIDTEKTAEVGVDSELCWAGQTADMLTYAGWTKKAGFKDEDDVYDLFSEVFVDEGGMCKNGFSWFMNGNPGSAAVKSDKKGGFLPDYPYDMFYDSEAAVYYDGTNGKKPYKFFRKMMKDLRAGYAIGLNVDWVDSDDGGAHAITLFGYIYNTSYKDTSLKYYDSFIIADSDSDKGGITDRRDAPNALRIVNVKTYKTNTHTTLILDRYGNGVLSNYEKLTPYSDSIPKETDPRATKNVMESPDLKVTNVMVSTSERPYSSDLPCIAAGQNVYVRLGVENNGAVEYDAPCKIHASLVDKDGKVLQNTDATGKLKVSGPLVEPIDVDVKFSPLSEGEYTIEGTIEPDAGTKEAYLINNSFSEKITVKNTPIDPSAVSISLSIPDFEDKLTVDAKITYSNTSYILENGFENAIAVSYLEDGNWTPYMEIYSSSDNFGGSYGNHNLSTKDMTMYKNGLTKTIDVGKDGTAISVRLALFSDSAAPIYYYSDPCDLKYLGLTAHTPSEDVEYDPIPCGATALDNSQSFEFTIENKSTYDGGKLTGRYYVCAECWSNSSLIYEIAEKKSITLGYGEKTDPIRISSWSKGIPYAGTYYVYLYLYDPVSKSEEKFTLGIIKTEGDVEAPYEEPVVGLSPITIKNKQVEKKNAETYIGRAVCDAVKLATKADIVLITTSKIKKGIKKGDITAPMLTQLVDEETTINRKKIKGKDIKEMMETSIDYMLKNKSKYKKKTLQIAGMTVSYNASAGKGKRIKQIKIGSKKIDNNKTYKVAMDSTTAYQKPYTKYGKYDYKAAETYWYESLEKYFNKSSSYIKKSVKKARYVKK